MKFEIKHRFTGSVLFSIETESRRLAVEAAVKSLANLYGADLHAADLRCADLYGADLRCADLYGADLHAANLRCADLRAANLRAANLHAADLRCANLRGVDLRDANLHAANLSGANLHAAKHLNKFLTTPLYGMLDQHDPLIAYKLVTADGIGPFNGGITYTVGQSYEEPRANTDERESCGAGINLASLDWCLRHYVPGYRILIVEFQKADIAAIPIGSDGKFRVDRCRIVGEKQLADVGLEEQR